MRLFVSPITYEEQKPFSYDRGYFQRAPASSGFGAFVIDDIINAAGGLWKDITGQSAQEKAQQSAVALAEQQTQRDIGLARARGEALAKVVPWLAVAVTLGIVGVVLIPKGKAG